VAGDADVSDSYRYQTISRVRSRLDRLAGDIEALEAHGDLADELREAVCGSDELDASDSDATVGRDGAETQLSGQRDESDTQPTEATDDALNAAINGLETTDDRREAVHACIAHLRKHTEAKKSDFTEEVYPDHNARYSSEGGWWNKIGKEYLQAVAGEVDPLKPPAGEGSHVWRWEV